ncbi:hypothetical protein LY78DRAFT_717622, partial [Colletotrichum sublineola]
NGARLFVTTIARQLAQQKVVPGLRGPIITAIQEDPDLPDRGLQMQFEKLILEPLKTLTAGDQYNKTLVLVIDALDECGAEAHGTRGTGEDRTRLIVKLLAKTAAITGARIRIFLTSRPELPITLGFGDVPEYAHQDVALHHIPESITEHDIKVFLSSEFELIRKSHNITNSPEWPGKETLQKLVKMAVPLFIYASTICKYVDDPRQRYNPKSRLEQFLSHNADFSTGIQSTYQPILEQLLVYLSESQEAQALKDFRLIIGTIVLLADPLPVSSLSQLLELDCDDVFYHLKNFPSVLEIPEKMDSNVPIKLFHLSFQDYLLANDRGMNKFYIEEKAKHADLLRCCLRIMTGKSSTQLFLKNDICQLNEPGVLREEVDPGVIRKHIPKHLAYACMYWVHHLRNSQMRVHDEDEVHTFLTR